MRRLSLVTLLSITLLIFGFGCTKTTAPVSPLHKESATEPLVRTIANVSDGTYVLDTETSEFRWKGTSVANKAQSGTIRIAEGLLVVSGRTIASGAFAVDMKTITDDKKNKKLEDHLKNDDFFSVANYPTSTFVIQKIERKQNGDDTSFIVTGDLTIKDTTRTIAFPATIRTETDGTLTATATFELDRTSWGIKYGSGKFFTNLGDKMIEDNFQVQLRLIAKQ